MVEVEVVVIGSGVDVGGCDYQYDDDYGVDYYWL